MTTTSTPMKSNDETGFSLVELLIGTAITLVVLVAATTLLAASLRTRSRENKRSDALAATQRALNMMSREIANTGYGLYGNGIVDADSGQASIRVRANLNNDSDLDGVDEDIRYVFQAANKAIVRFDPSVGATTVMATNINSMAFTYWDAAGAQIIDPANYSSAERITIDVGVNLPADVSQPASSVRLVSDVSLRNAPKTLDQF
jgi:type II secretory pathway pseudopilin PulG